MKNIGKYMLAMLMLVAISSCSNEVEDTPSVEKAEVSRTAITVEKTIELTEPGTLQVKLEAAMEDEDVSTLQKLTLSGPFTGTDVQYWKTSLGNLIEIDLTEAVPTYVQGKNTYKDPYGNDMYLYDKELGGHIFSFMTKLEKIIFPTDLKHIGHEACNGCTSLIEVVLPNSISLNRQMFKDCSSLTTLSIPNNIEEIPYECFWGCSSLASFELPATITKIQMGAFQNCTSLKEISIPDNVTEIYHRAFRNTGLTSIEISPSVTMLDSYVFADCQFLQSAKIMATTERIAEYLLSNCPVLAKVELSSTITRIDPGAFKSCFSLKDFTPFKHIKEIYSDAFRETSIESIDLSNVAILEGGFRDCAKLKSVIMPDTITTLGARLFYGCGSLEEIELPATLKSISDGAFAGTALKHVQIPKNVKSIGYEAFWTAALESVTLPEGLEVIGVRALAANNVTEFIIPSTVKEIGEQAFRGTKIRTLTVPANVTKVGGSLIDDCGELIALVWNSKEEVKDPSWGVNMNCFLYLPDNNVIYGPNWRNIIINGVTESVTLCEGGRRDDSNVSYHIPIGFKAKKITFERNFDDWISRTYFDEPSGWQTIVLPFTPTKIEHESKGIIAPFNSDVKGAKPFWLRKLTTDGFVDVTTFVPDVPYIIAVPNHEDYLEEYRLYGKITFSAENVDLKATPDVLPPSEGPNYMLQPTYNFVQSGPQIYALNVTYGIQDYHYGGVFARSSSNVHAFEAYVVPNGRSSRSVFEIETRSKATRTPYTRNKTGIPQIGDM